MELLITISYPGLSLSSNGNPAPEHRSNTKKRVTSMSHEKKQFTGFYDYGGMRNKNLKLELVLMRLDDKTGKRLPDFPI